MFRTELERTNAAGCSEALHDRIVSDLRADLYGHCAEHHPGTFYDAACPACTGTEYDADTLRALIADRDGDPEPLAALRCARDASWCLWCGVATPPGVDDCGVDDCCVRHD